nr:lysoplasmalogenase family protein [Leptospira weilii]
MLNTYFFWGTPGIIYTKLIPLSLCILYVSISWRRRLSILKIAFLSGLVFALIGDYCLVYKHLYFLGIISFILSLSCYILYFSAGQKLKILYSIPFLIFIVCMYLYLNTRVTKDLLLPVFVYLVVLSSLGWRCFSREQDYKQSYIYGSVGAILIIFSDSLLALVRLGTLDFVFANQVILGTYFFAQYSMTQASQVEEVSLPHLAGESYP